MLEESSGNHEKPAVPKAILSPRDARRWPETPTMVPKGAGK